MEYSNHDSYSGPEDLMTDLSDQEIASQLRKPHDDLGHDIGVLMNKGNSAMNRHAIAVLHAQAGEHILEVGMGNGAFVSRITNVAPGIRYTGCDHSAIMVRDALECNRNLVEQGIAHFVQAPLSELPFESQTFDKVFSVNTLYFWDDNPSCIREIRRVLKPDGHLILSIRPKVNMQQFAFTAHSFRLFDADEVIDLLEKSGFRDVERTSVQEPPIQRGDAPIERSSVIFKALN